MASQVRICGTGYYLQPKESFCTRFRKGCKGRNTLVQVLEENGFKFRRTDPELILKATTLLWQQNLQIFFTMIQQ